MKPARAREALRAAAIGSGLPVRRGISVRTQCWPITLWESEDCRADVHPLGYAGAKNECNRACHDPSGPNRGRIGHGPHAVSTTYSRHTGDRL